MLPAEALAFAPPPNPPNPPSLGGEPKGELVEGVLKEDDPNGLDAVEAPKGLEVDPEADGAAKLKVDEEDGGFELKTFVVGSEGLDALSVDFEEEARDAAGGKENADALVDGKENGEEDLAAAAESNFGVKPLPNGGAVDEEASVSPNPEKEAGGVGMEKEVTLAVERDEELDFL